MPRKLQSWTDAFFQYTEKIGSPPLFRRWCGIFTVAAALERKVWTVNNKGRLYPNLYMFLVGPPGTGKTVALDRASDFFQKLETHHLAPTSLTRASMIDHLEMSKRTPVNPMATPPVTSFHSLTIMANELGTLLPVEGVTVTLNSPAKPTACCCWWTPPRGHCRRPGSCCARRCPRTFR